MTNNYVFDNSEVGSLVYSFNQLGTDIVGAEVGAFRAQCTCCLLQKCANIKKIYLIDPYTPHIDSLQNLYFDEKDMEWIRAAAHHNVKWSGHSEKAEFLELTELEAADKIADQSLDFVYLDAWIDVETAYEKIKRWESKIRPGGIVSGHDWNHASIRDILENYRYGKQILNVNNTWMWYKD